MKSQPPNFPPLRRSPRFPSGEREEGAQPRGRGGAERESACEACARGSPRRARYHGQRSHAAETVSCSFRSFRIAAPGAEVAQGHVHHPFFVLFRQSVSYTVSACKAGEIRFSNPLENACISFCIVVYCFLPADAGCFMYHFDPMWKEGFSVKEWLSSLPDVTRRRISGPGLGFAVAMPCDGWMQAMEYRSF